jgi:hypothetical protein
MRQHAYRPDDDASDAERGDGADTSAFTHSDAVAGANSGSDSCACAADPDAAAHAGSVAADRLSRAV